MKEAADEKRRFVGHIRTLLIPDKVNQSESKTARVECRWSHVRNPDNTCTPSCRLYCFHRDVIIGDNWAVIESNQLQVVHEGFGRVLGGNRKMFFRGVSCDLPQNRGRARFELARFELARFELAIFELARFELARFELAFHYKLIKVSKLNEHGDNKNKIKLITY